MILTTKHFLDRVQERYKTNKYNKVDFVIETFKNVYKKLKKNKGSVKHIRITQEMSKYGMVYKMCYGEFKYYYSINGSDVILVTFGIRTKI